MALPRAGIDTAALDDPRFEPERLLGAARELLCPFEQVSTDEELTALWHERFEPWLPAGWRTWRRPGGWGADVVIRQLEVITFRSVGVNEPAETVIRAWLRVRRWPRVRLFGPFVRAFPRRRRVLWLTLVAKPGEDWQLTRTDFDAAGEYHLEAETVPEPTRDPALHDEAVHELARDQPGKPIIGTEDDAARQLIDLSLTDGRFAPAVVEAAVRSLIRAWRRFTIGEEDAYDAFAALSNYEIAEYARSADLPASLQAIDVVAIVRTPRPGLFLRIAAVVQVEDGTRNRNLWWKLELDDDLEQHWRLTDAYARPELRELRDS